MLNKLHFTRKRRVLPACFFFFKVGESKKERGEDRCGRCWTKDEVDATSKAPPFDRSGTRQEHGDPLLDARSGEVFEFRSIRGAASAKDSREFVG